MAIPFTVEDDSEYEEALLQQLFADLWHTLQQIERIQRSRNSSFSTRARPATATTSRRRRDVRGGDPAESERRLPDSLVNLALSLSPAGSQSDLDAILQPQNLSTPTRRRRRRRTQSEPPNVCDDPKPVRVSVSVEVKNKDWAQQEKSKSATPSSSEKPQCGSEGLLSKLVPPPLSGPLWTAVICVVGWHLLRAR